MAVQMPEKGCWLTVMRVCGAGALYCESRHKLYLCFTRNLRLFAVSVEITGTCIPRVATYLLLFYNFLKQPSNTFIGKSNRVT